MNPISFAKVNGSQLGWMKSDVVVTSTRPTSDKALKIDSNQVTVIRNKINSNF